jgi:hypothetical protein
MRYGFKGRDAFKQLKKDVYDAQFYEPLEDSPMYNTTRAYGSYFLYEMNNSTKQFKIATFVNMTS